jgi:hypothetical protein
MRSLSKVALKTDRAEPIIGKLPAFLLPWLVPLLFCPNGIFILNLLGHSKQAAEREERGEKGKILLTGIFGRNHEKLIPFR